MVRLVLVFCLSLLVPSVQALAFDHSGWDDLLKRHVRLLDGGRATQVDYSGMKNDRAQLKDYLATLSTVSRSEFDGWPKDTQLAFLLNAYNGWTVELILTKYPDLESIKDLGSLFRSPWKKRFIPLFGERKSLDDIEHGLIRGTGRYNDPRIHFAVNCASIGCPALRAEPYDGARLQVQLEEAARLFLQDLSRNRLDGRVLKVSSIFKWYREDFEQGFQGSNSLAQFLAGYGADLGMDALQREQLLKGDISIGYLDYDWKLNAALP